MLDPTKEHGFKHSLAQQLMELLEESGFDGHVNVEQVRAEHAIEGGRLDILIYGTSHEKDGEIDKWLLIIEAKVDAAESQEQLDRYETWINKSAGDRAVYKVFLTPRQHMVDTADDGWIRVSFLELACAFRRACSQFTNEPGKHFLVYYISGLLRDVCGGALLTVDAADCADPYSFMNYLQTVHDCEKNL